MITTLPPQVHFDSRYVIRLMERKHYAMFEHVEGSRLCSSLYKHYTMPDGRQKHLYAPGHRPVDEVHIPPERAPPAPHTLAQALQVRAV